MPVSITGTLSKRDLAEMVEKLAENPEFAAKLADAIATRIDEKFGWQQGLMSASFDEISKKLDRSIEENTRRFDRLDHNIQDLRERHELNAGEFRKVNDRLDKIDDHLGINTNTRGQKRFGGTGAGTGQKEF